MKGYCLWYECGAGHFSPHIDRHALSSYNYQIKLKGGVDLSFITKHGLYPAEDLYPADDLYPVDDDGGYFKLNWNGEEFVVDCHDYLPEMYWFVATMSAGGLKVYAVPFDVSFIANATVILPS